MKHWRQGDLLFITRKALPKGPHKKRENGYIAEGEATGHIHRLADLANAEVVEIENGVWLSVNSTGVSIVHEEHKPLTLEPGIYEVRRQREYSPKENRIVED